MAGMRLSRSMSYNFPSRPRSANDDLEFDRMPRSTNLALFPVLVALSSCSDETRSVSAQPNMTAVSIRLVDTDPVIEVKINGSPIDVQFDIGTEATLAIFPGQLESIAKRRIGTASGGLSMSGPLGERPVYEVDLIEIGDIQITNARIVEDYHDSEYREWFSSRLDAYGFLGRGLLGRYRVVIDYSNRALTLISPAAQPEQQAACTGTELPLVQGQDWGLVSKAETEIGELVLVWDTGTPASGVLKRRTDLAGLDYEDEETLLVEQFDINGHNFGPMELEVWDWRENSPPFDGFIGYDFFADNVVCVDFPDHRIFVQQ